MPCLTTWAQSCSAMVLPMWTMSSPKGLQKHSHSCSCRGCKATNHTGTLLNLPKHWNSPETLRNLPEVASGTYPSTPPEPSGSCLRNLHKHTLEPSRTYTSTHWNPPEPSGSCFPNLHQHTPEPSGTFRNLPPEPRPAHTGTLRNLPPEPTPAHTGTLRNLLEPSSGTCSSDPHRHTPELIWAEDPIGLRCWGIKLTYIWKCTNWFQTMIKSSVRTFWPLKFSHRQVYQMHLLTTTFGSRCCLTIVEMLGKFNPRFVSISFWIAASKLLLIHN